MAQNYDNSDPVVLEGVYKSIASSVNQVRQSVSDVQETVSKELQYNSAQQMSAYEALVDSFEHGVESLLAELRYVAQQNSTIYEYNQAGSEKLRADLMEAVKAGTEAIDKKNDEKISEMYKEIERRQDERVQRLRAEILAAIRGMGPRGEGVSDEETQAILDGYDVHDDIEEVRTLAQETRDLLNSMHEELNKPAEKAEGEEEGGESELDYDVLAEKIASVLPEVDYDMVADKVAAAIPQTDAEAVADKVAAILGPTDENAIADKVAEAIPLIDYDLIAERVAAVLQGDENKEDKEVKAEEANDGEQVKAAAVDYDEIATRVVAALEAKKATDEEEAESKEVEIDYDAIAERVIAALDARDAQLAEEQEAEPVEETEGAEEAAEEEESVMLVDYDAIAERVIAALDARDAQLAEEQAAEPEETEGAEEAETEADIIERKGEEILETCKGIEQRQDERIKHLRAEMLAAFRGLGGHVEGVDEDATQAILDGYDVHDEIDEVRLIAENTRDILNALREDIKKPAEEEGEERTVLVDYDEIAARVVAAIGDREEGKGENSEVVAAVAELNKDTEERIASTVVSKFDYEEIAVRVSKLSDNESIAAAVEKKLDYERIAFRVAELLKGSAYTAPTPVIVSVPAAAPAATPAPTEELAVAAEPAPQPAPEEDVVVVAPPAPKKKPVVVAVPEEEEQTVRYKYSFTAKIITNDTDVKEYYSRLKNEFLSYPSTSSQINWANDRFSYENETIAKVGVRGKTLCLYLALDPYELPESVYHQTFAGDTKMYEKTPTMVKIKSGVALKRALRLIGLLMEKNGAVQEEVKNVDYAAQFPYRSEDDLLQEGLVKAVLVGKSESDFVRK